MVKGCLWSGCPTFTFRGEDEGTEVRYDGDEGDASETRGSECAVEAMTMLWTGMPQRKKKRLRSSDAIAVVAARGHGCSLKELASMHLKRVALCERRSICSLTQPFRIPIFPSPPSVVCLISHERDKMDNAHSSA